ncbi:MAG: metalloregulator ArsR/SmtB family transcription factor [Bacillota bacterium]|nr:metalloregulator ArsR/SmtB family transcription factor [Bacillota bacterium]
MTTKQLAKIYKALSNENRLEIFLNILKCSQKSFKSDCCCTISQIIQNFCIGAPTISHHLKELSNAGLIETKKDGKYLVAYVNKELLEELKNIFDINS